MPELWTLHRRRAGGELIVVGEAGLLALVPPLWALWHGAWLLLAGQVLLLGAVAVLHPLALGATWVALAVLCWTEGASLRRWTLGLAGWREVGAALAGSEAGAEEAFLTGQGLVTEERR